MPRNSAGTYSLPESPFVANTPISSAAVNSDLSDVADAITDSLSRDGQGGMNAQLGLALSGFNYTSDPDTGISRSAANTQVITCGDEDWTFTATDLTTPDGLSLLPLIGEIKMWAFVDAPTGWVLMRGQQCTSSTPLWRAALIANGSPYGTSGGNPLFPNMQCVVPAGVDSTGRGLLDGSTVIGALLGQQSETIAKANLPSYTLGNTMAISDTRTWKTSNSIYSTGANGARAAGAEFSLSPAQQDVTATGSISLSGGITLDGSGTALPVVQPTIVVNFIGRAA